MFYNFDNVPNIHNAVIPGIDDEQLEGSGFQFQEIEEAVIEVYKVNDIKASSWVELPPKYKNTQSIINIKNEDQMCFLVYFWPIFTRLRNLKIEHQIIQCI